MITKNSLKPSESSCQLALTLKLQHALTQIKLFLFQDQFTSFYIYIYIYHICVFLKNMSFSPFIFTEPCRLGLFLRSAWYGRLAHTTPTSQRARPRRIGGFAPERAESLDNAPLRGTSVHHVHHVHHVPEFCRALSHAQIILSQWGMEFWCFGVWTKPHAKTSRPMSERFIPG